MSKHATILSNYSLNSEILGRWTEKEIFVSLVAPWAALLGAITAGGWLRIVFIIAFALSLLGGIIVLFWVPPELDVVRYLRLRVNHITNQSIMLHDSNPSESGITQQITPFVRLTERLPVLQQIPIVRLLTAPRQRTQDMVPVEQPIHGHNAIKQSDSTISALIRVKPANVMDKTPEAWEETVNEFGKILAGAIDHDAQMVSRMRSVDYGKRRSTFRKMARKYAEEDNHVLADICEEKAAKETLLEKTTMHREHYFVVSVRPDEVAFSDESTTGGLKNVPKLGPWLKKRRLKQKIASGELEPSMLKVLEQRVSLITKGLERLEGLRAFPVSATEYSRVLADHFQAANAYAYGDFAALVRQSPAERGANADYEVTSGYETLADQLDASPEPTLNTSSIATEVPTLGKTVRNQGQPAAESIRDLDKGLAVEEREDTEESDDSGESSIPVTDAEYTNHYQSLIAPQETDTSDPRSLVLDGTEHTCTLWIEHWPANPHPNMLDAALSYAHPGVAVDVTTHLVGLDQQEAQDDARDAKRSLKYKRDKLVEKDHDRTEELQDKYETAAEIELTLQQSDSGLFKAGTYITLRAETQESLQEARSEIMSLLKGTPANCRPMLADYHHDEGLLTTAPLAYDSIGKQFDMLGRGLGALFPYHSHNVYETGGAHFGTHAKLNEPVMIDPFKRTKGYNMGFFGDIGSGKTIRSTGVGLDLKLQNPDWKFVALEPLQEFSGLCQLFDGERIVVGGDTGLNPLHIEPTPEDKLEVVGRETPFQEAKERAISVVDRYYDIRGYPLGKKRGVWEKAIDIAYRDAGIDEDPSTHGEESPTFMDVIDVFKQMVESPEEFVLVDDDAGDTKRERKTNVIDILNNDIEPLLPGGSMHYLAKPMDVDISGNDFIYIDLQITEGKTDDRLTGLLMQIVYSLVYEQIKATDTKTLFSVDEAHYMTKYASSLEFFTQFIRHSRHFDVSCMFSTQSITEFFKRESEDGLTDDADIILNNLATIAVQPLEEWNEELADDLGFSPAEYAYADDLEAGSERLGYSEALLRVKGEGCIPTRLEMDMDVNPREFAVLDYDPTDHGEDFWAYLRERSEACSWTELPQGIPEHEPAQTALAADGGERE
ncbi:VirB4 family type IV secretion system protein [Haladaptatus halobius]|uniref:VirB4 family type IV secretion system protein n=1 Tax=Haladaptatus halobius TaxID=2884875 RepID=UPI001D0A4714|nr:type IV secretory system conjugative DNA transfer family protein [Haladaptatus halobius]